MWATTSVAIDGAFLEGLSDEAADVLARAAVAGRGYGAILMGLSSGVVARVGMTDTAYRLRGRGLWVYFFRPNGPDPRLARGRRDVWQSTALPFVLWRAAPTSRPAPRERVREIYGVNYPRLAKIKARATIRRTCFGSISIFCLTPAVNDRPSVAVSLRI